MFHITKNHMIRLNSFSNRRFINGAWRKGHSKLDTVNSVNSHILYLAHELLEPKLAQCWFNSLCANLIFLKNSLTFKRQMILPWYVDIIIVKVSNRMSLKFFRVIILLIRSVMHKRNIYFNPSIEEQSGKIWYQNINLKNYYYQAKCWSVSQLIAIDESHEKREWKVWHSLAQFFIKWYISIETLKICSISYFLVSYFETLFHSSLFVQKL